MDARPYPVSFLFGFFAYCFFEIALRGRTHFTMGLLGGGARGLHHFTEFVGGACDITINWKGTAEELLKLDGPVLNRMDTRENELIIDELLAKSEVFRKAWLRDGLSVDEFENFPPVRLFRSQFEDGWAELVKEIENA